MHGVKRHGMLKPWMTSPRTRHGCQKQSQHNNPWQRTCPEGPTMPCPRIALGEGAPPLPKPKMLRSMEAEGEKKRGESTVSSCQL